MTSPRKPRYRIGPALPTRPWERDGRSKLYRPRHLVRTYTMPRETVPAIRERHGGEA